MASLPAVSLPTAEKQTTNALGAEVVRILCLLPSVHSVNLSLSNGHRPTF